MQPDADGQDLELQRSTLINAGRLHWFHWLIVSLSLLLTLGAWYFAKAQLEEKVRIQFEHAAGQVLELISERMQKYEDGLWGGVGAIQTLGGEIDHRGWLTFADSLSIDVKYPGINGIGVIYYVPPAQRDAFLAKQRLSRSDFDIHPAHGESDHLPITFIEPVAINREAVGLDIAHETNRYLAAQKARDSGAAQITGPIFLVQNAEHTPGFLFYAPFYRGGTYATRAERRQHFAGMVYAPFVVKKLMQGVLAKQKRNVGVQIVDDGVKLYDELVPSEENFDPQAAHRTYVELPFYGRTWGFDIWSGKSFNTIAGSRQPLTILIAGIFIDAMLLALFVSLSRANRNALNYAERATARLRETAAHERELEARVQAEKRFHQVVACAPSAMLLARVDGSIVLANAEATCLFGHGEQALLSMRFQALIPARDFAGQGPWWEAYGDESAVHAELQAQHRDGRSVPVEVGINRIEIDGEPLLLAVVVDVTERERAKRSLAEHAAELARSNEELDKFAYVASHDLKAPLRGIQNLATFISEDAGELLPAEARNDLDLLLGRARRMEALLDGLLQYSRIGRRESEPEYVATAEVVNDVIELCVPLDRFQVDVQPGLPEIHAPQAVVHLVFRNLLANAVKHHDREHGVIVIEWRADEEHVVVTVRDDGPGIPFEHRDRVFQLFQTLQSRDEVEGSGLGLALIKKGMELHGGRIELCPAQGRGATFRQIWPRRDRRARRAA